MVKIFEVQLPSRLSSPGTILRTAHSCASTTINTGPSADDIRGLRTGEIDPDPETKPARPDPIEDGLLRLTLSIQQL